MGLLGLTICKKPSLHETFSCIQTTMIWITCGENQNFDSFLNETETPFKYKHLTKEVNFHHMVYIKLKYKL